MVVRAGRISKLTGGGVFLSPLTAHGKGILLEGHFRPTETAQALSRATHFQAASTPVLARFSSSTGLPHLADTDARGNPRGLALRFVLAETPRRVHTDIVAHSVDGFPGRTGADALAFFRALRDGGLETYLAGHPEAAAFVAAPKPFPVGFDREAYFGVHAFRLVAGDGTGTFVRYRFVPMAGTAYLDDATAQARPPGYLFDGVAAALVADDGGIAFRLEAQVAAPGDPTDDCTARWPDEARDVVDLGTVRLDRLADDQAGRQKHLIFDPVPRVDGVEPSDDPLLHARAAVYLVSGRERRAA